MYESDYEDEAQFTEETLQDGLRELITEGYDSSEICWESRPTPAQAHPAFPASTPTTRPSTTGL